MRLPKLSLPRESGRDRTQTKNVSSPCGRLGLVGQELGDGLLFFTSSARTSSAVASERVRCCPLEIAAAELFKPPPVLGAF